MSRAAASSTNASGESRATRGASRALRAWLLVPPEKDSGLDQSSYGFQAQRHKGAEAPVLVLTIVGLLAVAVLASPTSPALAYGRANWQVAINGTATFPGTGTGFGF